jgi:hypothetical protein
MFPHSCFPVLLFLDPSAASQVSAMDRSNGIQSPTSPPPHTGHLVVLRWVLGWQAPGYDSWLWCGALLLANLKLREFFFFSCYAMARLVPLVPSFLLTLLELYGLQLQHLLLHSFVLVAMFAHFCEMFIGVRPSVPLFWVFHVLCWTKKGTNPISPYYFQL